MDINITNTRSGYTYATAKMSLGRFEPEDAIILLVSTVLVFWFIPKIEPHWAFIVSCFILLQYKRKTKDQLPGHINLVMTLKLVRLTIHPFWGKRNFVKKGALLISNVWRTSGLIAPPTEKTIYER